MSRMSRLTGVDEEILAAIAENGGELSSLLQLTDMHGIDYSHAHFRVRRLAASGRLVVSRPGRDLVLRLPEAQQAGNG